MVTLSTVGYGDIVPATHTIRLVATVQVVAGVFLLLFGVQVLLTYASETGVERKMRDQSQADATESGNELGTRPPRSRR